MRAFTKRFNGKLTNIGYLELSISEAFISSATRLKWDGKKWLKGFHMQKRDWSKLLQELEKYINWDKGASSIVLKLKWRTIFFIIEKYILCE